MSCAEATRRGVIVIDSRDLLLYSNYLIINRVMNTSRKFDGEPRGKVGFDDSVSTLRPHNDS